MSFANSQYTNIDRSAFYDIQGNYYNGTLAPGERGIHELFKASCPNASHDSQARHPPPRCLPATHLEVLKDIFDWIAFADERILWISGPAGPETCAISQKIAEACAKNSTLAGSFFFGQDATGRDTAERLIPSLVHQLAMRMPHRRTQIGAIVEDDLSVLHKSQYIQIRKLILPLFTPTSPDETHTINPRSRLHSPCLMIIDGLHECKGENDQFDVVASLAELVTSTSVPLFCIITSRPDPQIERIFARLSCIFRHITLDSQDTPLRAESDISAYLRHGLSQIYQSHNYVAEQLWPTDDVLAILAQKSDGAFMYASTLLKYVDDDDCDPVEQLGNILNNSPEPTPSAELDHLYRCVMGAHKDTKLLLLVFTVICSWKRESKVTISEDSIEELLLLPKGTLPSVLRRMHPIFDTDTLSFHDKSFADFIHNKTRAREYFIDAKKGHAIMAQFLVRHVASDMYYGAPYNYAKSFFSWHCQVSGRWDENLQLLEEFARTVETQGHRFSDWETGADMLRWLKVEESDSAKFGRGQAHNLQYQLFKAFFGVVRRWGPPMHVFELYETINPEILITGKFTYGTHLFIKHFPGSPITENFCWSWILVEGRKSHPETSTQDWLHEIVDPLMIRLLQEPGSLQEHYISVGEGHRVLAGSCLLVLSRGYPSHQDEPEEYSYARKYWKKHLSRIPTGNREMSRFLTWFDFSKVKFSTNDVEVLQTWMTLSGVTPNHALYSRPEDQSGSCLRSFFVYLPPLLIAWVLYSILWVN